ncbi:MAG: DASS family sodium-coupled anion symporter [Candidatus Thorarchaeota archaeon]|nr:DASS family sodium-coupled anion symporter [Candidatus Thorarchaeota archaeon]
MSKVSKKTIAILIIASMIGLILYNVAPPEITAGKYTVDIEIESSGISLTRSFNVTFVESGETSTSTVTINGTSTNVTIELTDTVVIAPDNAFTIKILATGEPLEADEIHGVFHGASTGDVSLRPTRQIGQTFTIAYQPLVKSKGAALLLGTVAVLWFTEGISLVATSIMIPILIVLLAIQGPRTALAPFFDPVVALILGGFLIGRALSKYDLDKRMALLILSKGAGSGPKLILTVMAASAFLSMWISNTASAAIMIPISLAVISRIHTDEVREKYGKALVLGVAYAATLGGVATLVGSTPNPLAASYISTFLGEQFSFMRWLPFGLPVVLIMLPIIWQWLMFRFHIPKDVEEIKELKRISEKEYHRLGPITTQQKLVLLIFVSVVGLWLTEKLPDFIVAVIGWPGHGISSSIVALIGGFALMVFGLIDENDISHEISWSSLLILGSGIALGGAMIDTGLSTFIAHQMSALRALPGILVIIIIGVVAVLVTMVASNTGAAVILIPIAIPLASELGIDPLLITMVIAIAVSMDYALPTGTPPSTIAYSTGKIEMREMVTAGLVVDMIAILVVTIVVVYLWVLMGLVVIYN